MQKITCIAIDDEPLALGLIASYINRTPFLELVGQFDNPIDALEFFQSGNAAQLIFLDIQMPDFTGIEFARALTESSKIIFTTAYEKYAIESFRLHALDYLLKPVSYEVFLDAVKHAQQHFALTDSNSTKTAEQVRSDEEYLFVKANSQLKRINYNEILYLEGLKDYIKLYLDSSSKPVIFYATMKSAEEKLPADTFMRVHRSFIVNLTKITTVENNRIIFNDIRIPISSQYKDSFDEFIQKRFFTR